MVPASPGAVRVGGISIEWWYGGLLAPVAAWAVAVWALRGERARLDGAEAVPSHVSGRADSEHADVGSAPSDPA